MGAPVYRGQTNNLFRTDQKDRHYARGQATPYDVNGAPTSPAPEPGFLSLYMTNLPSAAASAPLFEMEVPPGQTVVFNGSNEITAGVAATATKVFPIYKNGVSNGNITVTGSTGTMTLSDSTYVSGDLFSLYAPASADATLDRLRASLGVD